MGRNKSAIDIEFTSIGIITLEFQFIDGIGSNSNTSRGGGKGICDASARDRPPKC